jgi:RHS repeat-associated protein
LPDGSTAIRSGTSTTAFSYAIADPHGTPSLYLDYTATTATWRQYTPYGDTRGAAVSAPDNRGFLNKPMDITTGLTIVGARQYDPSTGRFITDDPVLEQTDPTQLNGYAYAGNNPIDRADPTGLWAIDPDLDDQYGRPKSPGTGHSYHQSPRLSGGSGSGARANTNTNFVGPVRLTRPLTFEPRPNVPIEPIGPTPLPLGGVAFSVFLTLLLGGDSAPDPYQVTQDQIEDQERGCAARTNSLSTISYLPLDDQGRARGAFGCLTNSATTIDFRRPATPPGYVSGPMDRGHLVAREFGGSSDLPNISPMYTDVNHETVMRPV